MISAAKSANHHVLAALVQAFDLLEAIRDDALACQKQCAQLRAELDVVRREVAVVRAAALTADDVDRALAGERERIACWLGHRADASVAAAVRQGDLL